MTVGIIIIAALVAITVIGAWHFFVLYDAIRAILIFVRHNEGRIHNLETRPPWLDAELDNGQDGGPHHPPKA